MKFTAFKCIWLFPLWLMLSVSNSFAELQLKDYWMVEEFFSEHPQQKEIFDEFNHRVQSNSPQRFMRNKLVNISIVYPGQQVSDYWRRSITSFSKRLSQMGIPFKIKSFNTKPGTDIALQSQRIRQSLDSNTDYLVFTLDALRHKNLIEQVMAQSHTKIILQNITTPLKSFGQQQPFMYVGFDHSIGSKMLAQKYIELAGDNSEYAILYGTKGYVSTVRGGTFQDIIANATNMKLVASYYVNFNRVQSATATRDILKAHPNIKFIYACSTDIALGVSDVLAERGLTGKVMVNGWGGGSAELDAIQNGQLNFTVMRMNDDNGVAMAEAIALDLENEPLKVPILYSGDFRLVDQGFSSEDIDVLKQRAFRYSK